MAKTYKPLGTDSAVVFERDGDSYHEAVRVIVHANIEGVPMTPRVSRTLQTEELGEIAAYCALVYQARTGKVPIPMRSVTPLKVIEIEVTEDADDFAFDLEDEV